MKEGMTFRRKYMAEKNEWLSELNPRRNLLE